MDLVFVVFVDIFYNILVVKPNSFSYDWDDRSALIIKLTISSNDDSVSFENSITLVVFENG